MTAQLTIKLLLIAGIVVVAVFGMRSRGGTHLALRRIGGLAFVVTAIVSVLFPALVTWLANRVGVGRGTDLVLYALVVAFLFVSVALYQRIHELEARLERLTRAHALTQVGNPLEDSEEGAVR